MEAGEAGLADARRDRAKAGSRHWTISATGCGSVVRLRPAGLGETSRRSAPEFTAHGGGWLLGLDSNQQPSG